MRHVALFLNIVDAGGDHFDLRIASCLTPVICAVALAGGAQAAPGTAFIHALFATGAASFMTRSRVVWHSLLLRLATVPPQALNVESANPDNIRVLLEQFLSTSGSGLARLTLEHWQLPFRRLSLGAHASTLRYFQGGRITDVDLLRALSHCTGLQEVVFMAGYEDFFLPKVFCLDGGVGWLPLKWDAQAGGPAHAQPPVLDIRDAVASAVDWTRLARSVEVVRIVGDYRHEFEAVCTCVARFAALRTLQVDAPVGGFRSKNNRSMVAWRTALDALAASSGATLGPSPRRHPRRVIVVSRIVSRTATRRYRLYQLHLRVSNCSGSRCPASWSFRSTPL
jgi:hypothetical protein